LPLKNYTSGLKWGVAKLNAGKKTDGRVSSDTPPKPRHSPRSFALQKKRGRGGECWSGWFSATSPQHTLETPLLTISLFPAPK